MTLKAHAIDVKYAVVALIIFRAHELAFVQPWSCIVARTDHGIWIPLRYPWPIVARMSASTSEPDHRRSLCALCFLARERGLLTGAL